MKNTLHSFTVSGLFKHRCENGIIQFSGFACLDIDHIDADEIKSKLSKDPYVYTAFKSVRGKGLAVLFRFPLMYEHKYKEYYFQLKAYLKDKYNLDTDKTNDICRLRYVSYDPELYRNQDCKIFEGYETIQKVKPKPMNYLDASMRGIKGNLE